MVLDTAVCKGRAKGKRRAVPLPGRDHQRLDVEVNANGVYTYASPKVRDLLGYEPGEIVGAGRLLISCLRGKPNAWGALSGQFAQRETN